MARARAGKSSPDHIPTLVARLGGANPRDRAAARVGLITLPPQTVPRLLRELALHEGRVTREQAVDVLSNELSSPYGLSLLIAALDNDDERVRGLARDVLLANRGSLDAQTLARLGLKK